MDKNTLNINEKFCLGWQETFDASLDIFALISEDFEILKVNKTGAEALGKTPDELIGKKCYEVVHGLNSPIKGCSCEQAKETGKNAKGEIIDRGRNYLTTASPIHDENNEFVAFAHTVKDITDLKDKERSLEDKNDLLEQKINDRTSELIKINKKLINEIEERKSTEAELKESKRVLQEHEIDLERKNDTLGEIIAQIELEKNKIKEDISGNIEKIVYPILEKLKLTNGSDEYLKILRHHLGSLSSQFGNRITKKYYKLSPREIELCTMIKTGLSSKEISTLLNISDKTVDRHRRNIRKKLEITNKRINLTSFLAEL